MSVDAAPLPPRREGPGGKRYPRVMTATVWNGAQKSTVAVRSVLSYDQRSTAREALTHAITAAMSSVIHIGWWRTRRICPRRSRATPRT